MSKKNRPPKHVHKNPYEGGVVGRKQQLKAKGTYQPKGPAREGEDSKTDQKKASYDTEVGRIYQVTTKRSVSSQGSLGSRRGLEPVVFSQNELALPPGVLRCGLWWRMGEYQFKMIERSDLNTGFKAEEVPAIHSSIQVIPYWKRLDTCHVYVILPENSTYVSVMDRTVEIPYTRRIINGQEVWGYKRTAEKSEILDFNG
jgi:hypothetical protein